MQHMTSVSGGWWCTSGGRQLSGGGSSSSWEEPAEPSPSAPFRSRDLSSCSLNAITPFERCLKECSAFMFRVTQLRSFGTSVNCLPFYTASHHIRLESSTAQLWEPQISRCPASCKVEVKATKFGHFGNISGYSSVDPPPPTHTHTHTHSHTHTHTHTHICPAPLSYTVLQFSSVCHSGLVLSV